MYAFKGQTLASCMEQKYWWSERKVWGGGEGVSPAHQRMEGVWEACMHMDN